MLCWFLYNKREESQLMEALCLSKQMNQMKNSQKPNKDGINNDKIIKLIRQKKYPLHVSNKSTLMFPRLRQKVDAKAILEQQMVKKYVEINLEDEKADPETRARTDIEHEIIHKYKLNANRKEKEQQRKLQRCLTRTFDCEPKSQRPSPEKVNSNMNRYSSCHKNAISQNFNNPVPNTDEENIIETENSDHSQYLAKIKSELSKKKEFYLKKINLTDFLDSAKEKENITIEYLVNELERAKSKQRVKRSRISAYQNVSPNHLSSFITILNNKKERPLNLWEEFQREENDKDRRVEDELRSTHLIQTCPNDNITILEEESEIKQENIISAKYRMKSNHKKLIMINKHK